jgi:hypothetical protein
LAPKVGGNDIEKTFSFYYSIVHAVVQEKSDAAHNAIV